jgi:hypothetical protein
LRGKLSLHSEWCLSFLLFSFFFSFFVLSFPASAWRVVNMGRVEYRVRCCGKKQETGRHHVAPAKEKKKRWVRGVGGGRVFQAGEGFLRGSSMSPCSSERVTDSFHSHRRAWSDERDGGGLQWYCVTLLVVLVERIPGRRVTVEIICLCRRCGAVKNFCNGSLESDSGQPRPPWDGSRRGRCLSLHSGRQIVKSGGPSCPTWPPSFRVSMPPSSCRAAAAARRPMFPADCVCVGVRLKPASRVVAPTFAFHYTRTTDHFVCLSVLTAHVTSTYTHTHTHTLSLSLSLCVCVCGSSLACPASSSHPTTSAAPVSKKCYVSMPKPLFSSSLCHPSGLLACLLLAHVVTHVS